jgi:beta-aspartyl-dipeptidase (metallo-type)
MNIYGKVGKMFKIIRQGHLFSPEDRGIKDILICQGKIARINEDLSYLGKQLEAEVIHADGKVLVPGFIDQHVHFLGGGDYEGPAGATTDIAFSSLTKSGVTTAVGCLGSDDTARNMLDLMRRARDLDKLGITTYLYTGSFNVPSPTITGNVRRDVMMVDKILGVKFAISEVMASLTSLMELAEVAKDSFLGGLISGKRGLIHIHIGKKIERMEPLFEILKITNIPIDYFIPTHVNRLTPNVMEHAIHFLKMGGTVDMSAIMSPETGSPTSLRPDYALSEFLKSGIPIERITLSSDGNVSMPIFDKNGNKTGLFNAGVDHLYRTFLMMVKNCKIPFSDILKIVTSNVARVLGIEDRKGSIEVGKDADLIVFNKDYEIEMVFAHGQIMVEKGKAVIGSYFE